MKNWKLFGITIYGFTIIPCYYDLLRYKRAFNNFAVKNLNIIRFTTIISNFRELFDTSII
jgi:hypothetical protein